MFPLSPVLFPYASMPLHVFEPRYRELMRDCLAGDARFGIVLIERGSEVGGGDQRGALGTRGVITEAAELPDGGWVLEIEGEALIGGGGRRARGAPGAGPAGGARWRAAAPARARARRRRGCRFGGLAAVRGRAAQRLRRPAAAGGGRRPAALAAPRRVDGRARARPAPHAARGVTAARVTLRWAPRVSPAQWPPSRSNARAGRARPDARRASRRAA